MAGLQIVGGGGLGCEVYQYVRSFEPHRQVVFLDDSAEPQAKGDVADAIFRPIAACDPSMPCLIAVGDPHQRARLATRLEDGGASFALLVHPRAYVAADARLSPGCIVAPFAFVSAGATAQAHALIGPFACVGHHARVGFCAVLSPYAALAGRATLEDRGFVGTHAVLTPRSVVGAGATVAAGAVVYNDLPAGVLALGNPARWRRPQGAEVDVTGRPKSASPGAEEGR